MDDVNEKVNEKEEVGETKKEKKSAWFDAAAEIAKEKTTINSGLKEMLIEGRQLVLEAQQLADRFKSDIHFEDLLQDVRGKAVAAEAVLADDPDLIQDYIDKMERRMDGPSIKTLEDAPLCQHFQELVSIPDVLLRAAGSFGSVSTTEYLAEVVEQLGQDKSAVQELMAALKKSVAACMKEQVKQDKRQQENNEKEAASGVQRPVEVVQ
jgi:hypothetical protein